MEEKMIKMEKNQSQQEAILTRVYGLLYSASQRRSKKDPDELGKKIPLFCEILSPFFRIQICENIFCLKFV